MRVDVCKYGTFRLNIKANNTRPHKWLIPYSFFVQNHIFSNQGDKLCFNALNFKRRNEYFFAHFVLLLEALQLFNSEGSPLYCRYSEKEESFFSLVRRKNFYFAKVCPIIIKQFFTSFGKHTITI